MILGARIPGSGRTGGPGDTPGSARPRPFAPPRRPCPGWTRCSCRAALRQGGGHGGVSADRCQARGPPRTITALLARHDHAIAPILARAGSPRMGREPKIGTAVDRDYETLRIDMQTLFPHVGIDMRPAAA